VGNSKLKGYKTFFNEKTTKSRKSRYSVSLTKMILQIASYQAEILDSVMDEGVVYKMSPQNGRRGYCAKYIQLIQSVWAERCACTLYWNRVYWRDFLPI